MEAIGEMINKKRRIKVIAIDEKLWEELSFIKLQKRCRTFEDALKEWKKINFK